MWNWAWTGVLMACACLPASAGQAGEAKEPAPLPGAPAGAGAAAPADAQINEILRTKLLSFDFADTSLADALSFFKATLGVNVVVAPDVDTKQRLTLRVADMNAGAALQWVARVAAARVAVKDGAIQVAAARQEEAPAKGWAGGEGAENEATRKIAEVLRTKKVTFDFVETPFADAVAFLQALVNVNIVVAPDVKKEQHFTLKVNDMTVGQALQWMVKLVGARMVVRDGAVFISADRRGGNAPLNLPGARDVRFHRMVGKAVINLGPAASVEFYLYEEDLAPELREAVLKALQKALAAELGKMGR